MNQFVKRQPGAERRIRAESILDRSLAKAKLNAMTPDQLVVERERLANRELRDHVEDDVEVDPTILIPTSHCGVGSQAWPLAKSKLEEHVEKRSVEMVRSPSATQMLAAKIAAQPGPSSLSNLSITSADVA